MATDRSHSGLWREGVHHPVAEGDRLAELGGHPGLDRGGLPDPDPVPDDGPGRRLVRGPEPDRAQPGVALLQPAHHRVALADGGEARSVYVEREDPLDLRPHRRHQLGTRPGRGHDFSRHLPAFLPHPDAGGLPAALHREGQLQGGIPRSGVRRRREALQEPDARCQRERSPRDQRERLHATHQITGH
jgi:hypothetical protein